jgi:hypothetical protein
MNLCRYQPNWILGLSRLLFLNSFFYRFEKNVDMKKLLIAFLFISQLAYSQSTNRHFVGLSIGPSFPLSDFGKSDLNDSTSGFAKTGVALSFNYAYRITHNFGVQLIISYSSNSLDNIKYRNALEAEHPDYGVSVESSKNWSSGGLLIGPYLRFPLTSNLSWDIRALGGYFGAYSPNGTINATNKNDPNDKKVSYLVSSRAGDFGYMMGTGFKYKKGSYYILLFGDYINASLDFKDASGWDWDGEPYQTKFTRDINYFTITGGVGYIL